MPAYSHPGVYVEEVPPLSRPIAGVGTSTAGFIGFIPIVAANAGPPDPKNPNPPPTGAAAPTLLIPTPVVGASKQVQAQSVTLPPIGVAKLYTSFAQFTRDYGELIGDPTAPAASLSPVTDVGIFNASTDAGKALSAWRNLAQAVFGFFNNGGTRCYVVNAGSVSNLQAALDRQFAGISEIAIVAAPGLTTYADQDKVVTHCNLMQDRVAVLDPQTIDANSSLTADTARGGVHNSDYAALYFPNIRVFDPTTQLLNQAGLATASADGGIFIGPSGHIAGVYARVDAARGAYKAPANEPLNGVMSLQYSVSPADQDGLNPAGINAIRVINGQILVWGARTLGSENGEFTYLSTRRYFNFLRKSLQEGTNFLVFEPNTPALWQRITRTVSDFLLGQWRDGGLFGDTPKQAFFVKCDADTNPPDQREQGIVVTMIGIAIVKPAEFVVFRIQQNAGG